ncbi:hypothetical protein D3C73_1499250 [compost metagenome]
MKVWRWCLIVVLRQNLQVWCQVRLIGLLATTSRIRNSILELETICELKLSCFITMKRVTLTFVALDIHRPRSIISLQNAFIAISFPYKNGVAD